MSLWWGSKVGGGSGGLVPFFGQDSGRRATVHAALCRRRREACAAGVSHPEPPSTSEPHPETVTLASTHAATRHRFPSQRRAGAAASSAILLQETSRRRSSLAAHDSAGRPHSQQAITPP